MPPYKRESAASSAAALKLLNRRGPQPRSLCVLSVKAVLFPKMALSTVAAALDCTECPEGYSGNGGVGSNSGNQLLSMVS